MGLKDKLSRVWLNRFYLYEYLSDVGLLTVWYPRIRKRRIKKWQNHVDRYASIATTAGKTYAAAKSPTGSTPAQIDEAAAAPFIPTGVTRIRFVAGHLDILDRKFASLLTFHGLLATVATLYINVALPHPVIHFPILFRAFAKLWVVTTFFCMLGFARAKWGDIGDARDDAAAETQQVKSLITAVVHRSAWLRFCVILTVFELALLVFAVRRESYRNLVQPDPTLVRLIGPFSPGIACSSDPNLKRQIEDAASQIQKTNVSELHIVGQGDAMPVGVEFSNNFGNNAGLALSRAHCVDGWLTDVLAVRNIHVDSTMGVQDANDRSIDALKHGDPADRMVEVWATSYQQGDH